VGWGWECYGLLSATGYKSRLLQADKPAGRGERTRASAFTHCENIVEQHQDAMVELTSVVVCSLCALCATEATCWSCC
jgi:hypothetical protein